jgi:hypothetical protein
MLTRPRMARDHQAINAASALEEVARDSRLLEAVHVDARGS